MYETEIENNACSLLKTDHESKLKILRRETFNSFHLRCVLSLHIWRNVTWKKTWDNNTDEHESNDNWERNSKIFGNMRYSPWFWSIQLMTSCSHFSLCHNSHHQIRFQCQTILRSTPSTLLSRFSTWIILRSKWSDYVII